MFEIKHKRKKAIILLIILSLFALLFKMCSKNTAVVYEYGKVLRGDVSKTIAATGTLALDEPITVYSKISGELKKIYVDYNSKVFKNQRMAYIESDSVDKSFLASTQTLNKAKSDLDGQVEFLNAKKMMLEEGLISQKDYDFAQKSYALSLSTYNYQKVLYSQMIKERNLKNVMAPSDGVIIAVAAEENTIVTFGTPLFLFVPTLKKMQLKITIDENDIGIITQGLPVDFSVNAYPEKRFYGVIKQVRKNPIINNGIVTYESLVICENPEEILMPGMTVSAMIRVATKKNVVLVPNQSLVVVPDKSKVKPDRKYVWIRRKKINSNLPVKPVEVKIGLQGDTHTEIESGKIKINDQVLTGFYQKQVD